MIAVTIIVLCSRRGLSGGRMTSFWRQNAQHNLNIETIIMNSHSLTPKRYTYSEIKKMTNSFVDKLGQGGFGGVYKGELPDGRPVAVKVLKNSKGDGEEFVNEVVSISRTSHVNIVTLLGFCFERTKRALIYEYMPNGSLDKFIYRQTSLHGNHNLQWEKLYEIAVGIGRGLEYLHRGCNTRIVHFDIKPHNILLDTDFCPKISDFGLAKLCKREESMVSMTGARGTAGYIAPEVFCKNFGGVSYKSDVYSYGMMVLEMVGGKRNIDIGESQSSEIFLPNCMYELEEVSSLHGVITDETEETIKKMVTVGLWCVQTNPLDRPSMTKVVEMLEGSLQFLQTPPKPFLYSPTTSLETNLTASTSRACALSQKESGMAAIS